MLNPATVRHDPAAAPRLMLTLLAVALLWPGVRLSELDLGVLFDGSNADTMGTFLSAFWPPEHSGEFLGLLWQATLETLAIATANEDSQRIADMIDGFGEEHIHDIFVSMDSHSPCHIAHAVSWHAAGKPDEHPAPFTQISNSDVINGVWVYVDKREEMQEWAKAYTGALERKGRMVLTIWPEHCIVGSKGHSVVPVINNALQRWAHRSGRPVNYIMKGQNLRVEMYSAIQAEVHDPLDQNTGVNLELLSVLKTSDRVSNLWICYPYSIYYSINTFLCLFTVCCSC